MKAIVEGWRYECIPNSGTFIPWYHRPPSKPPF
jgi:hypothetical protein